MLSSKMWPIYDVRALDIRISQINFATSLRRQKNEKLIFKYERKHLTNVYFVYWYVFFDMFDDETMVM